MIEVYLIGGLIGAVWIFWSVREELRKLNVHKQRGTEPGQGYTVQHANIAAGKLSQSTTWNVPKDPQQYAKFFVPDAHKKGK